MIKVTFALTSFFMDVVAPFDDYSGFWSAIAHAGLDSFVFLNVSFLGAKIKPIFCGFLLSSNYQKFT